MNRKNVSNASIVIPSTKTKVWQTLVDPQLAKTYFFGADIKSTWKKGDDIIFEGEYNGNKYLEKGKILSIEKNSLLQYTHWSNLETLSDIPENYRIWTFKLEGKDGEVRLSVSEDNIPTEKQKLRSDEFWSEVLSKIAKLAR